MKIDYNPADRPPVRRLHRIVLVSSLCVVAVALLVSRESTATRSVSPIEADTGVHVEAVFEEQLLQEALADPIPVPEPSNWTVVKIKSGDTLSSLFREQGLSNDAWLELLDLGGDVLRLQRLKLGDELQLRISAGRLEELHYTLDELRTLQVRREGDALVAHTLTAELERRSQVASGVIENSLFLDARRAGVSDRLILEFAELFGFDVDFALDLRRGDRFNLVYETLYRDGERLRDGDIVAAEFVNRGQVFRALRYIDDEGKAAYYTPQGESLRKAILRSPIEFARISSHFNLARKHPILNTIRAHKGTDYAAAAGTPIRSVGDGKVEFVGQKNGFGNVVIVRHGNQYQSLYAHMSRFKSGLRVGDRVRQAEVVGYVGMTGLATAPHLHYEFRVNGTPTNPVTVPLPRSNPIPASQMAAFRSQSALAVAALETASTAQLAALAAPAAQVTEDEDGADAAQSPAATSSAAEPAAAGNGRGVAAR